MFQRTMSCTSEDFPPTSARSETAPYFAEMQELRYTVRVLKEELEELHSTPATPVDILSPKRAPPCASLADVLDFNTKLRLMLPLETVGGSGSASPVASSTPVCKQSHTPGHQSNQSFAESFQDPRTLEYQVLHTLLISELYAAEGIGRQAITLEQDGALQEVHMMHDWFLSQHRLLLSGLLQLQQLEGYEREKLLVNEQSYYDILLQDLDERLLKSSHKEALYTMAVVQLMAEEVKIRQAIETEEGVGEQEAALFFDWLSIQRGLHLICIQQMVQLEALQRDHLMEAEKNFRTILYEEKDESVRQALLAIRSFRLPLDHVGLFGSLFSQFGAAENTCRQVIEVQERSAAQEIIQLHHSLMGQQRLHLSGIQELVELECIQRQRIVKNEQSFFEMLERDESESAHQASIALHSHFLTNEHEHYQKHLLSQFLASEETIRSSISLEQDARVRQVEMFHDWCKSHLRLSTTSLLQLQDLEERARSKLRSMEHSGRVALKNERAESCNLTLTYAITPRVLESSSDQVLNTALESHILACEVMGRTAVVLDEECGRQALKMFDDWHQSQSKLRLAATHQLLMLEGAERSRIIQAEDTSWSLFVQDEMEIYRTPQLMSSLASSVGEDISSTLLMEELQEHWALREHLHNSSMDGPHTPLSSSKSDWGQLAVQSLVSRQRRALRLLVQQESNDWARLIWFSDVELTRCGYNALLQTQLSHGRLAEKIEDEEADSRNALKELFETELLGCLQSMARRRCEVKVCEVWENERWIPMTGWSKGLLERPHYSDSTGKVALDLSDFDSIITQQSLCWSSQGWELDISSSVDSDGWQYALAFNTPFHPAPWLGALVRRRKWVRACEPLLLLPRLPTPLVQQPPSLHAPQTHSQPVHADSLITNVW
eukprot:GGOE01008227.1.p1 GENE.GGOE01008227.1~~GGOE01008227.1.p1  ORF type:complete len:1045 (-),score=217.93 GGOE01008227.1:1547-4225(-)